VLILFSPNILAHQIGTISQWNGSYGINYIGEPGSATATYGQTFSVSTPSLITSWDFWLSNHSSSPQPNVQFDVYLMDWVGDRAGTNILFKKQGLLVPPSPRGEFHDISFALPDIKLEANKEYVMLLNTSNYGTFGPSYQAASLAAIPASSNAYSGGDFWYQASYNLFSNVYNFPWSCANEGNGCRYGDAAFSATILPIKTVPIPATFWLFSAVLSLLAGRKRFR
jgi:hypothetical protein